MNFIRNVFALIGLVAVLAGGVIYVKVAPIRERFAEFDPKAMETYMEMMGNILKTGNAPEGTVWRAKVQEGVSFEDVDETIKFVANQHNIKNVGELPLWKQVEAMTGEKQRIVKIYMLCNPLVAYKMMDHSDAYSAYLPCRVSVVEDKKGEFSIYSLNMDPMIYGGLPLPPELKAEAIKVKEIILDIMKKAASGDL